ncbi:MAG: protein kinase [archaeon]|nr:protein kinase [archaeon]
MELLGKSLEQLKRIYQIFTLKTVAQIGYQMMNIMEFIHSKHIIHRDIKPDNFVMGLEGKNNILFLVDFGLAKKYRSYTTLEQYPLIKKKKLTGTARYASIHALEGFEQSRRDDLESIGYVLIYLLKGNLPWQGVKIKTGDEKYKNILEKKRNTSAKELSNGIPEFEEYITYTRSLEYTDAPDYRRLKGLFRRMIENNQMKMDWIYDWTTDKDLEERIKTDLSPSLLEDDVNDYLSKDITSDLNKSSASDYTKFKETDKVESCCCIV